MLNRFSLLLVFLGALGLSFFLIPTEEELALLNLTNKNFSEAVSLYEGELHQEKVLTELEVIPLAELYLHNGSTQKAQTLLQQLIAVSPKSLVALRYLAKIYKDTQNTYAYVKTLEKISLLEPDPKILREISAYKDFIEEGDSQTTFLQRLVDLGKASPQEKITLARLYMAQNNAPKAIRLLHTFLPKIGHIQDYTPVYFLLEILLSTHKKDAIIELAHAYVSPDYPKASLAFLRYLVGNEHQTLALELGKPLLTLTPVPPSLIQWHLDAFIKNQSYAQALNFLKTFAQQKKLSPIFDKDLVSLALMTKNAENIKEILPFVVLNKVPETHLLELAEFLFLKKESETAQAVEKNLGDAFLKKNPLLFIMIHATAHNTPNPLWLQSPEILKTIPLSFYLPLARMFLQAHRPDQGKILLSHGFSFKNLKGMTLLDAVDIVNRLGLTRQGLKVFMQEFPDFSSRPLGDQEAWALLALGSGKKDAVEAWVKENKASLEPEIMERLLDRMISDSSQSKSLKILLAETLYERQKDDTALLRLVDVYLSTHAYAKAEPFLKTLALSKQSAWEWDYIEVLKKLNKKSVLNHYLASKAASETTDVKKKREIGFALLNTGDKRAAAKIFMDLAQKKPPDDPDVQQLLFIWGLPLPEIGLKWVTKRAEQAPASGKAPWLRMLNDAGESMAVIAVVESLNLTDKKGITELYIAALEAVKDRRGLKNVLSQEIEKKTDLQSLIKLSELASYSGNPTLEKQARKKLITLYPEQPYVLKLLAERALAKGKYEKAQRVLKKLFAQGHEDPQSLYSYAETVRHQEGLEKSKSYYEKIIQKLSKIKQKKTELELIKAKSLYFIGEKAQAISKYREIVSASRKNKLLRADIAHFLMDVGELEEAERILNG